MARQRKLMSCILGVMILACPLALAMLWAASYGSRVPRTTFSLAADRFQLRWERGQLHLYRIPRRYVGPGAQIAATWIQQRSNEEIEWDLVMASTDSGIRVVSNSPRFSRPLASWPQAPGGVDASAVRDVLLEALDDPKRFAFAHVVLCDVANPSFRVPGVVESTGDTVRINYRGLHIDVRPDWPEPQRVGNRVVPSFPRVRCQRPGSVRFDVADLPALRRQWHEHFGVRCGRVPLSIPMALSGLPLAGWGFRRWVRWRRYREGKCPRCGYDLRASRTLCPECGEINRRR